MKRLRSRILSPSYVGGTPEYVSACEGLGSTLTGPEAGAEFVRTVRTDAGLDPETGRS